MKITLGCFFSRLKEIYFYCTRSTTCIQSNYIHHCHLLVPFQFLFLVIIAMQTSFIQTKLPWNVVTSFMLLRMNLVILYLTLWFMTSYSIVLCCVWCSFAPRNSEVSTQSLRLPASLHSRCESTQRGRKHGHSKADKLATAQASLFYQQNSVEFHLLL